MQVVYAGEGDRYCKRVANRLHTPGKSLDVKVQLDKKQTASGKVTKAGGSVSLVGADGSKFTLDVPANAVEAETTITMTAVKTLDGAPLDTNTPTAVQLEPSGLFFKEMVTLTIVPAKEIPIKEQIAFGYEGDGKDYHLAVVDPKSKDVKIKLMHFSGAGVGSGADAAWAANLMVQAREAETRIYQKLGEYLQENRRRIFFEGEESIDNDALAAKFKSALDQYEEQVVLKEMVAAELDCHNAPPAIQSLLGMSGQRGLLGLPPTANFGEKLEKLIKITEGCRKAYRVSSSSNNVSFSGEICGLDKPFIINGTYPGGLAQTSFAPSSVVAGTTTVAGGGGGCEHSGGGTYTVSLKEDGSGTLIWTTSDKIACPGFSNSRTATFTLPLQPTSDLSCP